MRSCRVPAFITFNFMPVVYTAGNVCSAELPSSPSIPGDESQEPEGVQKASVKGLTLPWGGCLTSSRAYVPSLHCTTDVCSPNHAKYNHQLTF